MKLSHRAYPYPVVGNGDDVVDTGFQAPIDVDRDGVNYYLKVSIQSSSRTIKKLVAKGDAVFVLHVECSNTMHRSVFEFTEEEREFMLPGESLNASVEVNVFARAKKELPKYKVENAHEDYGDMTFRVAAGDILAIAEGYVFDADINFDALSEVGSFMQIKESEEADDAPMLVDLTSDEKIIVWLCKPDFANYKYIRNNPTLSSCIASTIVLPALADAIREASGNQDFEDAKWCRSLKRRAGNLGQTLDSLDPLELAQKMLELPIRRALASARTLLERED